MVRTLPGALFAALGATTRIPAVNATIEDHLQHFNLYQSPANTDNINDACVASDGSILRVRVTRSGITSNFQYQRITNPATPSQWSTWTTFTGGSGNMFEDGGCAISNNGGTLRAFAQRITGGNALRVWNSLDHGVSWSAPVTVLTPPGLMRGAGSAGNNDIFILYDAPGGGVAMGASFFSGAWSALQVWTFPAISFGSGLAPVWDAANSLYYVVYSNGRALLELTFNPGTLTWNAAQPVAPAEVTSANHMQPRISFDPTTQLYHLVTIEFDNGLSTGSAYQYPRVWQSANLLQWSVGKIFPDISSLYGACYIGNAAIGYGAAYIISMSKILQESYFTTSSPSKYLDVSSALLSYTRTEISSKPSKLEMTLDNNAGNLIPFLGTPISANCSLVLREGYKTGNPPTIPETIKVNVFRINQILIQRSPHENQIKIIAYDQSRDLDLINRFQMTYNNFAVGYLITEICARAGLFDIVVPNTSQMTQIVPFFVLQSGQSFRRALDELCNTYGLEYFFDQDEFLQFREIDSLTLPIWTYQPEVELIIFCSDDLRANHVIVNGKPPGGVLPAITSGEAFDETDAHLTGLERLIIHTDLKLTTAAQCASKAAFILDSEKRAGALYQATIPLNPALQLLDVITLTDYAPPQGSGQTDNALLVKIRVSYDATTATYSMKLDGQGV